MTSGTGTALEERYGTGTSRTRRPLLVVVVVVVAAFAGWLGWTTWEQSRPTVASGDLVFSIVDGNTASASFVVDLRDPGAVVSCRLRAYAEDHSLVGQADFAPDLSAGSRVTHVVSTDRLATTVELEGCTAPGQSRPR